MRKAHGLVNDKIIVMSDFDAKIGHSKREEKRKNRQSIRRICFRIQAVDKNTFFIKKPNWKWTWVSPDHRTKNEIDFII